MVIIATRIKAVATVHERLTTLDRSPLLRLSLFRRKKDIEFSVQSNTLRDGEKNLIEMRKNINTSRKKDKEKTQIEGKKEARNLMAIINFVWF